MAIDATLDDLILGLYDAAFDDALWPSLLTTVADLGGSTCCHLLAFDLATRLPTFGFMGRYPQEAHEDYAQNYAERDPRLERLFGRAGGPQLGLVTDDDLAPPDVRRRCAVHQEFLPRWGVDRVLMQGFAIGDAAAGYIGLHRSSKTRGAFGGPEGQLLGRLVRHLGKAFELRQRVGHLQSEVDDLGAAMDTLSFGVLLTDGRGRIGFASRKAEELLRRGDGLSAVGGRLTAVGSGDGSLLRRLLERASRDSQRPRGGAMSAPRPGSAAPYQVVVAPLSTRSRLALATSRAEIIVLVTDPDETPPALGDLLATLYQLTQAETKLALGLFEGLSLQTYAERHGIARDTAKNQLARVFSKCDCRRQSELIKLIAAIPVVSDAS